MNVSGKTKNQRGTEGTFLKKEKNKLVFKAAKKSLNLIESNTYVLKSLALLNIISLISGSVVVISRIFEAVAELDTGRTHVFLFHLVHKPLMLT